MEVRKADLLMSVRGERRKEVEKIKTSETSVRRYVTRLSKRGLLGRVVKGRPSSLEFGPGYVSKYRVAVSEKQRYKFVQERKKKRKRRT
ncbi:hypothetical protein ES703_85309 [subsurface metagenome]